MELGLAEQETWAMSLPELAALTEVWQARERRADIRTARLCALIANAFRTDSSVTFSEADFLPQPPRQPQQQTAREPQSMEQMMQLTEIANRTMGGETK